MTDQEYELVQYLRKQYDNIGNFVMVERDILEKSLSFFIENKVEILSLSAMKMSNEQLEKVEELALDYSSAVTEVEKIMREVNKASEGITHYEMEIGLKTKN